VVPVHAKGRGQLSSGEESEEVRVSTLELFFDLVFVFTITQLTSVLTSQPNPRGLLAVVLMLGVIWWMYGGYAWLTNAVAPTGAVARLLLMVGMAGFLVVALAVPHAFAGDGLAFGLGYLLVTVVHAGLFTRTSTRSAVRAILRIAPFNLASALLVVAGGLAGGVAEYALWGAAFVLMAVTPFLSGIGGFRVEPAHFVERHGLVVIIVLGESVVAVGIGVSGQRVGPELVGVAVLGLALAAGLWWLYFGGDDALAERALTEAPDERRPRLALYSYGYAHVPILLGVVALAAGVKRSVGHAFEAPGFPLALALGGGVALYLFGDALFRRSLRMAPGWFRAVAGAVALASVPVGLAAGAVAQLAFLVALVAATAALEKRLIRRPAASPARAPAAPGAPRRPSR
jgi:low temperature requirement protein LtrA